MEKIETILSIIASSILIGKSLTFLIERFKKNKGKIRMRFFDIHYYPYINFFNYSFLGVFGICCLAQSMLMFPSNIVKYNNVYLGLGESFLFLTLMLGFGYSTTRVFGRYIKAPWQ